MSTSVESWNGYLSQIAQIFQKQFGVSATPVQLNPPEIAFGIRQFPPTISLPALPNVQRYETDTYPSNPFAHTVRHLVKDGLTAGESFILTAWTRAVGSRPGKAAHVIELAHEPYTNLLYYPFDTGAGWSQAWLPFRSTEEFSADTVRYQLLLRGNPQSLEIGGLAIFRLDDERQFSFLPNSFFSAESPQVEVPDCPVDEYHRDICPSQVTWRRPPDLEQALHGGTLWGRGEVAEIPVSDQVFTTALEFDLEREGGFDFPLKGDLEVGDKLHLQLHCQSDSPGVGRLELVHQSQSAPLVWWNILAEEEWHLRRIDWKIGKNLPPGNASLRLRASGQKFRLGTLSCWTGRGPARSTRGVSTRSKPWRDAALERIERHRKSDVCLRVVGPDGVSLADCAVRLTQVRHAFQLGTAVNEELLLGADADSERYREQLLKSGFNTATLEKELSWPVWHSRNPLEKSRAIQALRYLREVGFRVRGHFLVAGSWENLPPDLSLDSRIEERILERLGTVLSFPELAEEVVEWDLFNEPFTTEQLIHRVGPEEVPKWFEFAHRIAPQCRYVINQDQLLCCAGLRANLMNSTLDLLNLVAAGFDGKLGLGLQCHLRGLIPGPERILRCLDFFSSPLWDVRITELDVSGGTCEEFRDFLIAAFSCSNLSGLNLWGIWHSAHWTQDALLFDKNWCLKPKGEVFLEQFQSVWCSELYRRTDEQGAVKARVFPGRYRVELEHEGRSQVQEVDLSEDCARCQLVFGQQAKKEPSRNPAVDFRFIDRKVEQRLRIVGCPCDDVILQNQHELAIYLDWLREFEIRRYLEIGSWTGRLVSYLHSELQFERVAACDVGWAEEAGLQYRFHPDVLFLKASSWGPEYREWRKELGPMDVVFIDGDHSYNAVRKDFEINRDAPHRFLAFHDIYNPEFGSGSTRFWQELAGYKYEIVSPTGQTGIGIWSAQEDPTPRKYR